MLNNNLVKVFIILGILLNVTACPAPSQLYWDRKVKNLCETDGGITVYENMKLEKSEYPHLKTISNGSIILPLKEHSSARDPAYIEYLPEVLINESPRVWRDEMHIVRNSDKKILAKKIDYSRRGGDIIPMDNESYYSCIINEEANLKLAMTVTFYEQ
jgi:hypothetical protein